MIDQVNRRYGNKCSISLLISGIWFFLGATAVLATAVLATAVLAELNGATDTSPSAEISSTIDKLVDVVEAYPGAQNLTKRRTEMRAVISPRFDFQEMAKRSLGPHWLNCSEDERTEFVKVFSDLLAKTYLNRIESIERGMVKVKGQQLKGGTALVKTQVKYKGDTFPLDYRLNNGKDGWKVYDVIIENIGLVANYRNEFAGIIRKEKFSGLLHKLKAKTL